VSAIDCERRGQPRKIGEPSGHELVRLRLEASAVPPCSHQDLTLGAWQWFRCDLLQVQLGSGAIEAREQRGRVRPAAITPGRNCGDVVDDLSAELLGLVVDYYNVVVFKLFGHGRSTPQSRATRRHRA